MVDRGATIGVGDTMTFGFDRRSHLGSEIMRLLFRYMSRATSGRDRVSVSMLLPATSYGWQQL
jgi:hypothetical protein